MRILICGGTGFLGRHIVSALAHAGHDPVVRSRHSSPALHFADATEPEHWFSHLQGIDAVINAVGALRDTKEQSLGNLHTAAPIALFQACALAGITRVVQVSALGVADGETHYATSKRAADEYLLALGKSGELNPVVVRPSIVFGADGASSKLFLALAKLPTLMLPKALQDSFIQPVAVRELAHVIAQLATSSAPSGIVEIGGPEPISIERFIASLRAQQGSRPATVNTLPQWMSKAGAKLGDRISWLPWCTETMTLLENNNITDPETLTRLLGHAATPPRRLLSTLTPGGSHDSR